MKKKIVRFVVTFFLSVLFLALGGCKGEDDLATVKTMQGSLKDSSIEKFRENSVLFPKGIKDILAVRQVDEKLWLISPIEVYYSFDMGNTWEISDKETAWIPENCSMAAISAKGSFAFYSQDTGVTIYDNETTRKMDIAFEKQEYGQSLAFVNERVVCISDTNSNVYIIDLNKGNITEEISAKNEYHYFTCAINNKIFMLSDQGLTCYDSMGKQIDTDDVVNDLILQNLNDYNSSKQIILVEDIDERGLFFASKSGLYHYASGGSIVEQLADGSTNLLGDSRYSFYRMAAMSDKAVLIVYRDRDSNIIIKKYESSTSDNNEESKKGELKVYSLYKSDLLLQEINIFGQNYPDCTINLEIGISDEYSITADDAMKTLNTEILAGTGPDIIILDGLPIDKLIEKNVLLDVTHEMEKVSKKEGIYENIATAYMKENKLYAIPARFRIPIMVGNENVLNKITDLDSLVQVVQNLKKENTDLPSILGLYNRNLLEYLFDFCSPAWIDSNKKIDQNKLKEFYRAAKSIQNIQEEGVSEENIALISEAVYSDDNEELDRAIAVGMGKQLLAFYNSKSLNFSKTLFDTQQNKDIAFKCSQGQSTNVFIPIEVIGINALSKNQELAIKFLEGFLSSESQSRFTITDMGYPINVTAFQKQVKEELAVVEDQSIKEVYQKGFEKIEDIISKLDSCCITDTLIRETIVEEGMHYILGEQSLDTALGQVVQKLDIYLSE